jgi:tetratricopeptide (TPR) repeat protein
LETDEQARMQALVQLAEQQGALGDRVQEAAALERAIPLIEVHAPSALCRALCALGDAYVALGHHDRAMQAFDRAEDAIAETDRHSADYASLLHSRGHAMLLQADDPSVAAGAVVLLSTALAIRDALPDSAETRSGRAATLTNLADALHRSGNTTAACAAARDALALFETAYGERSQPAAAAVHNLVLLLRQAGDLSGALAAAERAVAAQGPGIPPAQRTAARLELAALLLETGAAPERVHAVLQAVAVAPDDVRGLRGLVELWGLAGRSDMVRHSPRPALGSG